MGTDTAQFRVAEKGSPYTYLGIDQVFQPDQRLTSEYKERLVKIWGSELSAINKARATNAWAVLHSSDTSSEV